MFAPSHKKLLIFLSTFFNKIKLLAFLSKIYKQKTRENNIASIENEMIDIENLKEIFDKFEDAIMTWINANIELLSSSN